jgi:hypothetical protein
MIQIYFYNLNNQKKKNPFFLIKYNSFFIKKWFFNKIIRSPIFYKLEKKKLKFLKKNLKKKINNFCFSFKSIVNNKIDNNQIFFV